MNRHKYIQQLLFGLFLAFLFACNSSTHSVLQVKTADTNRITSISLSGGKYQIDTAIILTNQNLQPLLNDLEKAILTNHNNTKEIPNFIKTFLDTLTDSDFSIANPNEDWQVGCCAIGPTGTQTKVYNKKTKDTLNVLTFEKQHPLPLRQLAYLGLGNDIALFTYFTGGIGKSEHVLIIKFADKKIVDFWCGNVMVDLFNQKDILEYLKANEKKHWGLNTNIIYL